MIIGERKCGTTSLYHYLVEHPAVLPCSVKETHFFSQSTRRVRRSIERYRDFFPSGDEEEVELQTLDLDGHDRIVEGRLSKRVEEGRAYITGEASANVLMTVPPQRVFGVLPGLKLIVAVRDPVARAFSHHAMHLRFKREGRWLFRFVTDYRRDFEREKALSRIGVRGPYLGPGRYIESLERWLGVFPRAQLKVVRTEDLALEATRADVLRDLCDFLELEPFDFADSASPKRNVASHVARDDDTAAMLRAYFQPYNARLEALLRRSMGW
ncbi:MAG: sulfotransferase [Nannocystaceae bacterium]|nr:sulfotransferase domain-containing protein [bacterium]